MSIVKSSTPTLAPTSRSPVPGILPARAERPGLNPKSGLTVVEVTILVAIVALLAAISLPAFFQNQEKKRAAECVQQLDAILNACKRQAGEQGAYPKDIAELVPAYFKSIPTCPSGGAYRLGTPEGDLPTCSAPGHHL